MPHAHLSFQLSSDKDIRTLLLQCNACTPLYEVVLQQNTHSHAVDEGEDGGLGSPGGGAFSPGAFTPTRRRGRSRSRSRASASLDTEEAAEEARVRANLDASASAQLETVALWCLLTLLQDAGHLRAFNKAHGQFALVDVCLDAAEPSNPLGLVETGLFGLLQQSMRNHQLRAYIGKEGCDLYSRLLDAFDENLEMQSTVLHLLHNLSTQPQNFAWICKTFLMRLMSYSTTELPAFSTHRDFALSILANVSGSKDVQAEIFRVKLRIDSAEHLVNPRLRARESAESQPSEVRPFTPTGEASPGPEENARTSALLQTLTASYQDWLVNRVQEPGESLFVASRRDRETRGGRSSKQREVPQEQPGPINEETAARLLDLKKTLRESVNKMWRPGTRSCSTFRR